MWARLQLRIGWGDLFSGAFHTLFPGPRARALSKVEGYWGTDDVLAAYSVRSGFDLLLRALDLNEGDEILFSALNVKGMVAVVKRMGLVPVPVDVDLDHVGPTLESLEKAISPRAKVLVVAHLFGARLDLDPVIALARKHGLFIVEDCAQAFDGRAFKGHQDADASLFSFGPIKVATALGGALIRVPDEILRRQMRALSDEMPVQRDRALGKRVAQFAVLKLVLTRPVMSLIEWIFRARGRDFDDALSDRVRDVAPLKGSKKLRFQPSTAMLRLLWRRIDRFDHGEHVAYSEKGDRLAAQIGDAVVLPARANAIHNLWVFGLLADEPERFIKALRAEGFDAATLTRSQAVPAPEGRPELTASVAEHVIASLLVVPCYPAMPDSEIDRQAAAIVRIVRTPTGASAVASAETLAEA